MAKFYCKPCFPYLGGTISDTVVEVKNITLTYWGAPQRYEIKITDHKYEVIYGGSFAFGQPMFELYFIPVADLPPEIKERFNITEEDMK